MLVKESLSSVEESSSFSTCTRSLKFGSIFWGIYFVLEYQESSINMFASHCKKGLIEWMKEN